MAYILFRGDYDKRRDPVKPTTPGVAAADARRPAAQPPRLRASGCCGRTTR